MIKSIFTLFFLLSVCGIKAQIVNKGTVYLSEGTDYSVVNHFRNEIGGEFINDGRAYFYGDFHNDGNFDFLKKTGESFFAGQDIQKLRGSETSYFYNITFNNRGRAPSFLLSGHLEIENQADFRKGIVKNRGLGGKFLFRRQAIAVNTSDNSFVDGAVKKIVKTDFIYPIGNDGLYRPAQIADLSGFNQFSVSYFHNNPDKEYPLIAKGLSIATIDNREYWKIDNGEIDDQDYQLSLSWEASATPSQFIDSAAEGTLIIVYWDAGKNLWTNLGGAIDREKQTITTRTQNFGIFTLGKIENIRAACEIEVYNFIDVFGANENKYMRIYSDCAQIQKVAVFNRWGIKVFETTNYGPAGDVFDGHSSGRLTVAKNNFLPTGNYFYIIDYIDNKAKTRIHRRKQGFIYLNAD